MPGNDFRAVDFAEVAVPPDADASPDLRTFSHIQFTRAISEVANIAEFCTFSIFSLRST